MFQSAGLAVSLMGLEQLPIGLSIVIDLVCNQGPSKLADSSSLQREEW